MQGNGRGCKRFVLMAANVEADAVLILDMAAQNRVSVSFLASRKIK